jgi:hypothetical protein
MEKDMPINLEYPGGDCPNCQEPIDDDKEAGDTCDNCDFEFEIPSSDEPEEGDYITEDHEKFYQYGKFVLTVDEDDDYKKCIREHMEENKFYPSVWFISDHGNAHLIDMSDTE